jgi:tetratricopeptide (TPR) repeat protein
MSANRKSDPKRLSQSFRGELDWIVMKALEKDRNRRYESASALAADVQRYLQDEPVLACPPSAWYRFRKFARRNRTVLTTATLVSLALVLGTVISVWQAVRATDAMNSEQDALRDLDEARKRALEQAAEARQALDRLSRANNHFQRGRYYANGEQWAKAHDELSRAVELRPDNSLFWYERGDLYGRMGLWDWAAKDYSKAFEIQRPSGSGAWLFLTALLLFAGDNAGYQRLCAEIPKRFDPRAECVGAEDNIVRAYTMSSLPEGDWGWAVDMGKVALKRRGSTSWNCHALGRAYFRAGKGQEAVEWLRKSLETQPLLAEGCQNYCVLAMAYHRLGQTQEAQEALVAGARVIDKWTQATLTSGPSLTGPPHWVDWPESLLLYREAKTRIDDAPPPEDARLWVIRGRALIALNRDQEASACYAKALKLGN